MSRVERPDFLDAYNGVEVPAAIHASQMTGEQMAEVVEAFFSDVQNSLDVGSSMLEEYFERETSHEARVETFRRRGGQAIAAVFTTFDPPGNRVATVFSKYELSELAQAELRTWQVLSSIVHDTQQS